MQWSISTPELFSWPRERRALGNPETKCLLIGFREEQSKASLIGAFMLARGVSRRSKVQITNLWLSEPYGACSPTQSFPEPWVDPRLWWREWCNGRVESNLTSMRNPSSHCAAIWIGESDTIWLGFFRSAISSHSLKLIVVSFGPELIVPNVKGGTTGEACNLQFAFGWLLIG